MRSFAGVGATLAFWSLLPSVSSAHAFGTPYILPIPFWIYAYGCAATLLLTFAAMGFFAGAPVGERAVHAWDPRTSRWLRIAGRGGLVVLRAGAVSALLLTILAGWFGNQDPQYNLGMSLFWIVFLLALAYLTLLVGDVYALINPWKLAVAGLERLGLNLSRPRARFPPELGYWPACVLYLALIWMELFVGPKPAVLASALLGYSVLTFAGVAWFGKEAWFVHADVFGLYFRLTGTLAPVEYVRGGEKGRWRVRLRPPFAGARGQGVEHLSVVVFVLFMLSSTTYDAIHDTALWTGLFWRNLLWLLQPLWGGDLGKAQSLLYGWYLAYRQIGLIVFPFLYLGIYLLALRVAKVLTGLDVPVRKLALVFCGSLIPIAVAYHFTHYYTFLLAEVRRLPWRVSDPFGLVWDLLRLGPEPVTAALQMGVVWHTQVAVLLAGHIAGVWLAHDAALKTFGARRKVIVSQVPLLMLMVVYTVVGLWILSLPLGSAGG
jgi:hypothetical protein